MFVQGTITLSGGMKKQIKAEQKSKKLFELAMLDENQKIEIFGILPPLVIKDSKLEIKIDKITDIKEVKTFFGPSNINLNYYISVFWCDDDTEIGRTEIISGKKTVEFPENTVFEISLSEIKMLEECSLKFEVYVRNVQNIYEILGEISLSGDSLISWIRQTDTPSLPIYNLKKNSIKYSQKNSPINSQRNTPMSSEKINSTVSVGGRESNRVKNLIDPDILGYLSVTGVLNTESDSEDSERDGEEEGESESGSDEELESEDEDGKLLGDKCSAVLHCDVLHGAVFCGVM